jgi:hypothetical protein
MPSSTAPPHTSARPSRASATISTSVDPAGPGDAQRLGRGPAALFRVVADQHRDVAAQRERERARLAVAATIGEHERALDPAVGLGEPAAPVRVEAELGREPRGALGLLARPREAIAALVGADRPRRVPQVAGRDAEPLVGRRRVVVHQRLAKLLAGLRPGAAPQRGPPCIDRLGHDDLRARVTRA